MAILDKLNNVIQINRHVVCETPIEGLLTAGAVYRVEGIQNEAGRIVVTNDRNKEMWAKVDRFLATDDPIQLSLPGL